MHRASAPESGRRVGSGYLSGPPSARGQTAATHCFPSPAGSSHLFQAHFYDVGRGRFFKLVSQD